MTATGAVLAVLAYVVTMECNVPLNDRLAAIDPGATHAADGLRDWRAYVVSWPAWDYARTVAALLVSALMVVGLRRT